MYKCAVCGNKEKFIGFVEEKGDALIYQDEKINDAGCDYSWIFHCSDTSWNSSFKVLKCYICGSDKITEI